MPQYSTQITLFPTSNLAADASTNTWSIEADDVAALAAANIAIRQVYSSCVSLFPDTIRQNNHVQKSYNRADPEPRAPVIDTLYNFPSAPSTSPLPPEVALCVSFQAAKVSGIPQSRRRGRVFLGPLRSSTLSSLGRPTAGTITTVVNAFATLRSASAAAATWKWVVWSGVQGAGYTITNGWVDDEFDTQRRRGRLPTIRSVYS